ncbi:MAG: hypothetical protein AAB323_01260 [Pseudomonadota bacterium]
MILSCVWADATLPDLSDPDALSTRSDTGLPNTVHIEDHHVLDSGTVYPTTPETTPKGPVDSNPQATFLNQPTQPPIRSSSFRTAILTAQGMAKLGVGGTTFVCTYMMMACAAAKIATPLGIGGVMLAAYHAGPESMLAPSVATTVCTTVRWLTGFAWATMRSGGNDLIEAYHSQYPV